MSTAKKGQLSGQLASTLGGDFSGSPVLHKKETGTVNSRLLQYAMKKPERSGASPSDKQLTLQLYSVKQIFSSGKKSETHESLLGPQKNIREPKKKEEPETIPFSGSASKKEFSTFFNKRVGVVQEPKKVSPGGAPDLQNNIGKIKNAGAKPSDLKALPRFSESLSQSQLSHASRRLVGSSTFIEPSQTSNEPFSARTDSAYNRYLYKRENFGNPALLFTSNTEAEVQNVKTPEKKEKNSKMKELLGGAFSQRKGSFSGTAIFRTSQECIGSSYSLLEKGRTGFAGLRSKKK